MANPSALGPSEGPAKVGPEEWSTEECPPTGTARPHRISDRDEPAAPATPARSAGESQQANPGPVGSELDEPYSSEQQPDAAESSDCVRYELTPSANPEPETPTDVVPSRLSPRAKLVSVLTALAVAVALMMAAVVASQPDKGDAIRGGPAPSESQQVAQFGPAILNAPDLMDRQGALGRPIYWAGDPGADKLELTVTADGGNILRYLSAKEPNTAGVRAVAMYPMTDAYTVAEAAGRRVGAITHGVAGGIVVGNTDNAFNGYLALQGLPFLIEVFDPMPGQAWRLLTSGEVVPVPPADLALNRSQQKHLR